jgi:hypothetical protein
MPFYELKCRDCGIFFELGTEIDLDLERLLCVDCASTSVQVLSYEVEAHSRIAKLMKDVEELKQRIEVMADNVIISDLN